MNLQQLGNFPQLQTKRLVLRRLFPEDDRDIFSLRSHKKVNKYLGRAAYTDIRQAVAFIDKINNGIDSYEWLYWAITKPGAKDVLGTICLWNFNEDQTDAEIGYELHPDFQKKGYMDEALKAVIGFANTRLKLAHIKAYTHQDNSSSSRLLEQNGFLLEANNPVSDEPDMVLYTLRP